MRYIEEYLKNIGLKSGKELARQTLENEKNRKLNEIETTCNAEIEELEKKVFYYKEIEQKLKNHDNELISQANANEVNSYTANASSVSENTINEILEELNKLKGPLVDCTDEK